MQALAFPMRLQENGLLRRQDQTASVVELLQVMARTPAGSWQGCPKFGLRDLFEDSRRRADVARLAMQRINEVFGDLGLGSYVVTEVVRELSPQRETDTYAITISNRVVANESFTTIVTRQQ
jgi:hypothetical protein